MGSIKFVCEKCGAPALVNITNDEVQGVTMRHLCLECADREETDDRRGHRNLNYSAVMVSVGVFVTAISLLADRLKFGVDSSGFGWKQWFGVTVAVLLVAIAAIVQVPTLLVIGVFLGLLTILADVLAFGATPGFGWHQFLGTCFGVFLVVAGLRWSRRKS